MIIKHGLVVDPASGLSEHMDILVKNGKIARIAPEISEDSEEILEAGGLVVGPGLIDTHVHFRDPGFTYKEDIHTGAKASAKGGFTTVICMANTSPTVDNTDTLKDTLARASKEDIRIFQAAAISTMESIMAKYPMHSASTVLHPLPKKHWWQETVFWRSVPVQML